MSSTCGLAALPRLVICHRFAGTGSWEVVPASVRMDARVSIGAAREHVVTVAPLTASLTLLNV